MRGRLHSARPPPYRGRPLPSRPPSPCQPPPALALPTAAHPLPVGRPPPSLPVGRPQPDTLTNTPCGNVPARTPDVPACMDMPACESCQCVHPMCLHARTRQHVRMRQHVHPTCQHARTRQHPSADGSGPEPSPSWPAMPPQYMMLSRNLYYHYWRGLGQQDNVRGRLHQSVPLPSVPLPSVPLPSVPLPSVPLPSVPLPSVPLPHTVRRH